MLKDLIGSIKIQEDHRKLTTGNHNTMTYASHPEAFKNAKEWLLLLDRLNNLKKQEGRNITIREFAISINKPVADVARIKKIGVKAVADIIVSNLPLIINRALKAVKAVNNKNPNKTLPVDINDLVQTGVLGMMIALRKYDPHFKKEGAAKAGIQFSTVAYWWVWQAMTGLFDQNSSIRVPGHIWTTKNKILDYTREFNYSHNRNPTKKEIAEALGVSETCVENVNKSTQSVASLDYKYPQDDIPMGDKISDPKICLEDLVSKNIAKEQFYNLLIGNIDDLELKAIAIRFNVEGILKIILTDEQLERYNNILARDTETYIKSTHAKSADRNMSFARIKEVLGDANLNVRPVFESGMKSIKHLIKSDLYNLEGMVNHFLETNNQKSIMEFTINNKTFSKALNLVHSVVPNNPVYPIFKNVSLKANYPDQTLTITGFDGYTGKTITLDGVAVEVDGSFTVPSKMFNSTVGALPDEDIKFSCPDSSGPKLVVEFSTGKCEIAGNIAEDYPALPILISPKEVSINSKAFLDAINMISCAVSNDATKHSKLLTGINIKIDKDKFVLAAIDGHRLAIYTLNPAHYIASDEPVDFTVPMEAIREFKKSIKPDNPDFFKLAYKEAIAVFSTSNEEVYTTILDGQYPPYADLIPQEFKSKLTVDRKDFLSACDRVSMFAKDSIRCEFDPDFINISVENNEVGNARDKVLITNAPEELPEPLLFNTKYLLEGLKALSSFDGIILHIESPLKPVIIKPNQPVEALYLIMPIMGRN